MQTVVHNTDHQTCIKQNMYIKNIWVPAPFGADWELGMYTCTRDMGFCTHTYKHVHYKDACSGIMRKPPVGLTIARILTLLYPKGCPRYMYCMEKYVHVYTIYIQHVYCTSVCPSVCCEPQILHEIEQIVQL